MTIWQKFGSRAVKTWIKAFALHNLYLTIPCLVGAAIIGGAVIYSPKPVDHTSPPVKISSPKTTSQSPATKTAASTTTTPAASTLPAASEPASQPVVEQPPPVIKPSPSSSVSNLTPVSSSNSSSGSNTAGSDTSGSTNASSSSSNLAPVSGGYASSNWSGYITPSGDYTSISAAWIADKPTSNSLFNSMDATWIGIGGINSADLIQVGTDNNVSPSGQITTGAFYELLPADSVTIPGLTITPGDNISASLEEMSASSWQISMTDITTGATFSIIVTYDSSNSSAEWIEEDPSFDNGRQAPFDDYGQIDMADCQTINAGVTDNLNESFAQAVTMVNAYGQAESTPSVIAGNGNSFNTYYDSN